ncbi:MAG TPA: FlgD immunoglobulin-like domain containing protein [Chitinivibrionales bacterium]|nr:FlgD immunoglobulin-like domain containing protein [Chitinivibrionales bacterium]
MSRPVHVGTFVNGDFYVVGACTVTAVAPAPTVSPARNGSVVNLDPSYEGTPFDDRSGNYTATSRKYPPITLNPGDALISTVSLHVTTNNNIQTWLAPGTGTESTDSIAAVLTCLTAPVPTDAFRPGYCDRTQKIYCGDSLRWNLLPNLARVKSMTPALLQEWSRHFYRSPWMDVCFFGFDAAVEYQVHYGREVARAVGIGTLFLICDFTKPEKDSLMIGLVQYGIDLWGIVRGCNASRGWQAHGGHGSGRKLAMVFAGIMLGDTAMSQPTITYPNLRIGEDMQTAYGPCWCSPSNVVYTGHQGLWNGVPVSSDPCWGPYEHLQPSQWPTLVTASDSDYHLGEDYRHCCTSGAWIGEALAALLLKAEGLWSHPAFFSYGDRWMTESDSQANAIIKQETGLSYNNDQKDAGGDAIVNDMWAAYRGSIASVKKPDGAFPAAANGMRLQITPNPLRSDCGKAYFRYMLDHPETICMAVYDFSGKKIKELTNGRVPTGSHCVAWDGCDGKGKKVGPGMYVVRCGSIMRKFTLLP